MAKPISSFLQIARRRPILAAVTGSFCLCVVAAAGTFCFRPDRSPASMLRPARPGPFADRPSGVRRADVFGAGRQKPEGPDGRRAPPPAAAGAFRPASDTQLALATIDGTSFKALPDERPADDKNLRILKEHFESMKAGCERFRRIPGYTATLIKQERIGSTLAEEVSLEIKVRHDPFSVYMKWLTVDPGKEILYVDGTNDGNLLVRLGGFKGRILPVSAFDPSRTVLGESRYPITKVGILANSRKRWSSSARTSCALAALRPLPRRMPAGSG